MSKFPVQSVSAAIMAFALGSGILLSCAAPPSNVLLGAPFPTLPAYQPPAAATPLPTRPLYQPGELVDYTAQSGDTLPALAARFNTTVAEILEANPFIPRDATTMPAGMPMQIPIYYLPLWGTPYQAFPDYAIVNGPADVGFDTSAFVAAQPGWLKNYTHYAGGKNRTGAEIVDYVATNFSISPRLLLALLEYQAKALSDPRPPKNWYVLNYRGPYHRNVYMQLVWAANTLNNGYYGWRTGRLTIFEHPDKRLERPDPWQNAGTVAIQYYFSRTFKKQNYEQAIGPQGLIATYTALFGDPWEDPIELMPVSLQQPQLTFPFPPGHTWSYTGGPHTAWGQGDPLAALDFAPPSEHSGCFVADNQEYATAMADGVVARSDTGVLVLDLDGDGDERTGWNILYFHLATPGKAQVGDRLRTGDAVGYPSCEGGRVTGTHVHIARKYNGEWLPADGALPFNMEGWIAHNGESPYLGTLTRGSLTITASEYSDLYSQVQSAPRK